MSKRYMTFFFAEELLSPFPDSVISVSACLGAPAQVRVELFRALYQPTSSGLDSMGSITISCNSASATKTANLVSQLAHVEKRMVKNPHTITLHSPYDAMSALLEAATEPMKTCQCIRLHETSPHPMSHKSANSALKMLCALQPNAIHTFAYSGFYPVHSRYLNQMQSISTLSLESTTLVNSDQLTLPYLVDLSLVEMQEGSAPVECISRFSQSLTRLRFMSDNIVTTAAFIAIIPHLTKLEDLALPDIESTPRLFRKIALLPVLKSLFLDYMNVHAGTLSPSLRRLQVTHISGDWSASHLSHLEVVPACLGNRFNFGPLLLPQSLLSAYLPVRKLMGAATCTQLTRVSWFVGRGEHKTLFTDLAMLGEWWPGLTHLCVAAAYGIVHWETQGLRQWNKSWRTGWDLYGNVTVLKQMDSTNLALMEILLGHNAIVRPLTDLTVMHYTSSSSSARLIEIISGIPTMCNLVLVNVVLSAEQLSTLAHMPCLTDIKLFGTSEVSQYDAMMVERREASEGACALKLYVTDRLDIGYATGAARCM